MDANLDAIYTKKEEVIKSPTSIKEKRMSLTYKFDNGQLIIEPDFTRGPLSVGDSTLREIALQS